MPQGSALDCDRILLSCTSTLTGVRWISNETPSTAMPISAVDAEAMLVSQPDATSFENVDASWACATSSIEPTTPFLIEKQARTAAVAWHAAWKAQHIIALMYARPAGRQTSLMGQSAPTLGQDHGLIVPLASAVYIEHACYHAICIWRNHCHPCCCTFIRLLNTAGTQAKHIADTSGRPPW